jgi:hypothetical protein
MQYFSILFWNKTLHVSGRFIVHHQEYSTVCTAIGVCHTGYAECEIRIEFSSILISLADTQHKLYGEYLLLYIQYYTPDDGQYTCPKHVDFYSKNTFEKWCKLLVNIIRIYNHARSSEC